RRAGDHRSADRGCRRKLPELAGRRNRGGPWKSMSSDVRTYDTIRSGVRAGLCAGMAIILDMDGVIIDSNPVHCNAWRIYSRRFGIEIDDAMQQRMYGKRNDE